MGTKVEFDNCFPVYSMREFGHDSNGGSWPIYYGDNGFPSGQYYYGFLPRGISYSHPGYNKDFLKQTMLEHEAIFKNQVYELHRLYKVQIDLMDEFKRKEGYKLHTPYETSSSSSHLRSRIPPEDARKWNVPSFPLSDSMSGRLPVSAADIVQSSVNMSKGKSIQAGPTPFQNCSSSKGSEASESRPTKLRRKMFDLELPADEYVDIDEVEQSVEGGHPPYVNPKSGCESGAKLFLNHREIQCDGDDMKSNPVQIKVNTLLDLNDPVRVEEPEVLTRAEFSGTNKPHNGISSTNFLGLPRDNLQNSQHSSINGTSNYVLLENKGNRRGCLSYILEAGHSEEELKSMHQSLKVEKVPVSSQPVQFYLKSTDSRPPCFHQPNHSKGESWRTQTSSAYGTPERNYFHSSRNNLESFQPAHGPTPSSFSQSGSAYSWDQSVLSWGKSSSLSPKSMLVQSNPCITSATLRKSLPLGNGFFWDKDLGNSSLRENLVLGSEMPAGNGFYHSSSCSSLEQVGHLPLGSITSADHSNDDKAALGSGEYFKISTPDIGTKTNKNLNLNVLSYGFSTCQNSIHPLKIIDRSQKQQDDRPSLPWITGKEPCSKKASSPRKVMNSQEYLLFQTPGGELFNNNELKMSFDHTRHEEDCRSSKMILGVPIFEKPLVSKHESAAASFSGPSCRPHPSRSEKMEMCSRKGGLDINMPYVPMNSGSKTAADEVLEKKVEISRASCRSIIDLNSCASDDDVPPVNTDMNPVADIDLEAPACPEIENGDLPREGTSAKAHNRPVEHQDRVEDAVVDEITRVAAEAIVDISASRQAMEDSLENPLHWFGDVISSFMDDTLNRFGAESSRTKNDGVHDEDCLSTDSGYFESMTLKLTECDFKEFLSKPREVLNVVEGTRNNVSGSRPQRGQARRGRQRRDFQRDILPGLASLSRHEVTEDLQTFGGLMRATGHIWHSGPRRKSTRNGCTQGRRRTVTTRLSSPAANTVCALLKQQLSNTTTSPVQLEDRNLIGWGRITRRPRQQRLPAGNPAAVALT